MTELEFRARHDLRLNASLTYPELNIKANAFASFFLEDSSSPYVPLMSDLTQTQLEAAVLGAWRAGKALIPLNTHESPRRLEKLIAALKLSRVYTLVDESTAEGLAAFFPFAPFHPARPGTGAFETPRELEPGVASYVIQTSGSTGEPRLVPVLRSRFALWESSTRAHMPLTESDVVVNLMSWGFDGWFLPFVKCLRSGAELHSFPAQRLLGDMDVANRVGATMMNLTPSQARWLLRLPGLKVSPSVRYSSFGGEILETSLAREWREKFPNSIIHNWYGPSECCPSVFHYEAAPNDPLPDAQSSLPIGAPHSGVDAFVDGAGVLWIASELVADPVRQGAPADAPDSWRGRHDCYRTGDHVEIAADGGWRVKGRADFEVKIRGRRVHLEELEAEFRSLGLETCLVFDERTERIRAILLRGYSDEELATSIRAARASVPVHFFPYELFDPPREPLSRSGKVDRLAAGRALATGQLRKRTTPL